MTAAAEPTPEHLKEVQVRSEMAKQVLDTGFLRLDLPVPFVEEHPTAARALATALTEWSLGRRLAAAEQGVLDESVCVMADASTQALTDLIAAIAASSPF